MSGNAENATLASNASSSEFSFINPLDLDDAVVSDATKKFSVTKFSVNQKKKNVGNSFQMSTKNIN